MANLIFTAAKTELLKGSIDWVDATIEVAAVHSYTANAAHSYMSDVLAAGGVVAVSTPLTGRTVTAGAADAADTALTIPTNPSLNHGLIIYVKAAPGGPTLPTSQQILLAHFDAGTGLPIQPLGNTIVLGWNALGILRIL